MHEVRQPQRIEFDGSAAVGARLCHVVQRRPSGSPIALPRDAMTEHRKVTDRRRMTRSGRRAGDPVPKLSATVLWELPDGTRCWILRGVDGVRVHISRGVEDLVVHTFDSEAEARDACAEVFPLMVESPLQLC
jgi:hypothetical protein